MAAEQYRVVWFPPQYESTARVVPLPFFTSEQGFTAAEASAVAELGVGDETCFDNWSVRVVRLL